MSLKQTTLKYLYSIELLQKHYRVFNVNNIHVQYAPSSNISGDMNEFNWLHCSGASCGSSMLTQHRVVRFYDAHIACKLLSRESLSCDAPQLVEICQ